MFRNGFNDTNATLQFRKFYKHVVITIACSVLTFKVPIYFPGISSTLKVEEIPVKLNPLRLKLNLFQNLHTVNEAFATHTLRQRKN